MFAATYGGGVFRSTDNGAHWSEAKTGLPSDYVYALGVCGTAVFAGYDAGYGVYRSTDDGVHWTEVNNGLTQRSIGAFAVSGENIFVGTARGVFLSTNRGDTWTSVSPEPEVPWIRSLAFCGHFLFAGLQGGAVWRRPLSEMVVSVDPAESLPETPRLHQNYPNPFNPLTTIKYVLPKSSQVTLSVFDMLGREVSVLVNERRDAGYHSINFDGSNLASGVYFYRLQTGDFTQTKRLLLLR